MEVRKAMAWVENDAGKSFIRVSIPRKDLGELDIRGASVRQVKTWVERGRERSGHDEKLDLILQKISALEDEITQIKNDQRRHISLSAQVANLLALMTTEPHVRLKNLRAKVKEKLTLTADEGALVRLFEVKSQNFSRYLNRLFPGLKSNALLSSEAEDEENERA